MKRIDAEIEILKREMHDLNTLYIEKKKQLVEAYTLKANKINEEIVRVICDSSKGMVF
jgi:phage host-nuclease inhibitor protein Gam